MRVERRHDDERAGNRGHDNVGPPGAPPDCAGTSSASAFRTRSPASNVVCRYSLPGSSQPIDGLGRRRTNQVVFVEDNDDHSLTVGRAHASIRYDTTRRESRVFDDGSHNGTRVTRDGTRFEVKPHDPAAVTLRSGDEIQVGTAALRIQI